jgi:para-nitrobenzyl esterase
MMKNSAFQFDAFLLLLLLMMGCAGHESVPASSFEVVQTSAGLISGSEEDGVHIFKGIPFAAPPVGELRWKEPQAIKSWDDTLICTAFGPSPVQNDPKPFMMWSQEFITPANSLSEDCLYLNVWTPAKSPEEKLPVLVWIYGGGFVSGSGACPVYDGTELAKQGIVYVTINYRVGVFGFMAHPELTAEAPHKSSGNYGLMDQVAALKWVNKNIAAFGGDPSRVTIAGQSAGAMGVQALVASPIAKGLFHGAIAQSGALTARAGKELNEAEKSGAALSTLIKTDLAGLRALSSDSILSLANTFPYGTYFPVVDGYIIPSDPKTIFELGKHNDVPVMMGWVTGDAGLAMSSTQSAEDLTRFAKATYGKRSGEFLKLFPVNTADEFKSSREKLGNLLFAGYADVQWARVNKSKSYVYQFSYVPTDKPGFPNYGAFHTSEVPFALKTLNKWDRPWTAVDRSVENYMSAYWVSFVKTGSPFASGLVSWTPFNPVQGNIMTLGATPEMKIGLHRDELAFLESLEIKK